MLDCQKRVYMYHHLRFEEELALPLPYIQIYMLKHFSQRPFSHPSFDHFNFFVSRFRDVVLLLESPGKKN
jgi:hypothetical protein